MNIRAINPIFPFGPLTVALFFLPVVLLLMANPASAAVDDSIYSDLLKKYVKNSVVDYAGFKKAENRLDQYLTVLEKTDTRSLSPKELFAFYVNAYNAWTIKLILGGYPGVKSIKELGSVFKSPWKKKLARIDGKVLTLDNIEHDILRARFKDPRVHFAVNCASKSCPPILSEPYTGAALDRQLDGATRAFLADTERNRLDGDTLYVSKIFKWFAGDFQNDVAGFFLKNTSGELNAKLAANTSVIKVKFLAYDWSLNGR